MSVGTGFGSWGTNRQQIRMEPNPMDKCTIVSAYHKAIRAEKPTISPGYFYIPAAKDGDFELITVGTSSWWKEVDEHQPLLEIPCSSFQVANAIVNDFIGSLVGVKAGGQKPAVFVVLGEFNKTTIHTYQDQVSKKQFKTLLSNALAGQKLFYEELVRIADILWARTGGNPLSIADDARMAAINLGIEKNKPWMQDFKAMQMDNCKACGFSVNPAYPVCPNCKNPITGIGLAPVFPTTTNTK